MRDLDQDELIDRWTLVGAELELVSGKRGATRLGFALVLRFYTERGRFPRGRGEIPDAAVEYVARQVGVTPTDIAFYEWSGRTIEYHRAQIRKALGFRECSVADADASVEWLVANVTQVQRGADAVRDRLLAWCRAERIEPPSAGRIERMVRSALSRGEELLVARVASRLDEPVKAKLLALVAETVDGDPDDDDGSTILASIRTGAGNVSLNTMLTEVAKLEAVRAVGVRGDVFADIAPKIVTAWRGRAAVEAPSHLRSHSGETTLTLLAALLACRLREITDTLVDLLCSTVHRINARAEVRVTNQLIKEFQRVTGKENLLFRVAEATVDAGDKLVREAVYPVASQATLRDLVAEFKSSGSTYQRTVKATLRGSYTNHYRAGMIKLLSVLEFRSNNSAHRPVLDALELIGRYAGTANLRYYPLDEYVPTHRGLCGDWEELVYQADKRGKRRVVRMVYEVCTFQALRDQLRCKEIWVVGADRWRNPAEDLPTDFEERRVEHYEALRKPMDPTEFITALREEMRAELDMLHDALPKCDFLEIKERKAGPIKLTPISAAPEPKNLRKLKQAVATRWGAVPLIDMLKEAVLRTGCLRMVTSVADRGNLSEEVLAERLLLAIYAYGTNTGIRAVVGGDRHGEDEIRYARRRYLTAEVARRVAIGIADATFRSRRTALWGEGLTAVASDSTHFGAFDQNIFTEWHSRYGGRGVLIYWSVEKGSVVIHSQLLNCSASEVHAMVEGAIHHGTEMTVESNYVDTHGQSEIGFGITKLLGFDLLPRIKRINKVKLYRPAAGEAGLWPGLGSAMTRPIRWDIIAEQYDQMLKYATAIRVRTASTEAILRRFMKANATHPTYQAMIELGRVQKTIFVCRYLRSRALQREINEGLNVVESWNRANAVIFYGKSGDLATNRRDEQEMSVLCLRILQAAMVYVNTLMLQDILADPEWEDVLTPEDRRGLTPLFWSHVLPYGEVKLNMSSRLTLSGS